MSKSILFLCVMAVFFSGDFASANKAESTEPLVKAPKGAKAYFISPKNGEQVPQKFTVKFGLKKMKVRPALEDPNDHKTGHHHIIINGGPIPAGQTIPVDEKHVHYGKAQTEAEIQLPPGKYSLTMQFADGAHRSYGPELSDTIQVEVK